MLRLMMTFYTIIGATIASVLVVIALVNGFKTLISLLIFAALGFLIALPVSYFVARAMHGD